MNTSNNDYWVTGSLQTLVVPNPNVAIPRKDEFGQNRQHALGR